MSKDNNGGFSWIPDFSYYTSSSSSSSSSNTSSSSPSTDQSMLDTVWGSLPSWGSSSVTETRTATSSELPNHVPVGGVSSVGGSESPVIHTTNTTTTTTTNSVTGTAVIAGVGGVVTVLAAPVSVPLAFSVAAASGLYAGYHYLTGSSSHSSTESSRTDIFEEIRNFDRAKLNRVEGLEAKGDTEGLGDQVGAVSVAGAGSSVSEE